MVGRIGIIATGVAGVAVLLWLCLWQVQRLEWKEGVIATLSSRLADQPIALPETFDPDTQEFVRVSVRGRFDGAAGAHGFSDAPFIVALRPHGAGYRVIQPFTLTDGRRVLVDRGFIPVAEKNQVGAASRATPGPDSEITVSGALRWPVEEYDDAPSFGASDNVWTGRDLPEMATLFGAEPVLIVAETSTAVGQWPIPQPLTTVTIKNDHLQYAITWGSLALVWALMTGWLVLRRK